MGKYTGHFLDDEAMKKVKKAKALDEALFGKKISKKYYDNYARIFKTQSKLICSNCNKAVNILKTILKDNEFKDYCHSCIDEKKIK